MAHVMKFTKASCGHMFAHFDRKAEHISNENLDRRKDTPQLQSRHPSDDGSGRVCTQECAEVHCQNRKDVNVMATWVVTVPKDLPEQEHKAFFQASYDFLQQRYGRENVVSAYVHMDEVTPHMHFAFVLKHGFKEDKKNPDISTEYRKVSAKEVLNRRGAGFSPCFATLCRAGIGSRGQHTERSDKKGNKSIEELKRQTATERLQKNQRESRSNRF